MRSFDVRKAYTIPLTDAKIQYNDTILRHEVMIMRCCWIAGAVIGLVVLGLVGRVHITSRPIEGNSDELHGCI